jgi:uncharacterized protein DUF4252
MYVNGGRRRPIRSIRGETMKATTCVLGCLLLAPAGALAQEARLKLEQLDHLAGQAAETVNISIDPAMLKLASGVLGTQRQNDAVVAMLDDIQGIYIRSFEFEKENAYTQADVEAVRTQLEAPGWSRLIDVDSRQVAERLQIYSWREGTQSGGLALLVAEPKELTVINIVGVIDLVKLGALQGLLGIPPLPDVSSPKPLSTP